MAPRDSRDSPATTGPNFRTDSGETSVKRHPKFCFEDSLVAIKIENTLFNVHKYQLMKSSTFSDMFTLAEESMHLEDGQEGSSPERPIVLNGVSALDFERLMTVLYASRFSDPEFALEASVVISAFRLANMWDFAELRTSLVLRAETMGCVDQILFAREFGFTERLVSAYIKLCERKERLSAEESHKLGVDGLLLLYRIQMENSTSPDGCSCDPNVQRYVWCGKCGEMLGMTMPKKGRIKEKIERWVESGYKMLE